ncbi:MAG: DDE-type integrase/transposase/recombinase [Candidatus Aenigmarchaeota archaeon]|nr:DDE-type integrase/transposase/recombinase [Candidatus Aenigmarchaeota archaeon]MDI6721972.1 DDE-type integrase/transposase/recombinase [Candidatus Aenigmarchaeota archaeon]
MDRTSKIAFIRLKLIEGWTDKEIREHLGIPERTYFYWKRRIEEDYANLVNKQKPGPKPQFTIDPTNSRRIQSWRKAYGWGPAKIEGHLNAHYGIHVPHNRIYQLLKEKNLNKPIGYERKVWGKKRWEREHSMTLWQGDWKDINCDDRKPMMTFYDDHSRFVTASRRFDEATMENTIKLLSLAFKKHGFPEQILTDNGSQFTNNRSEELTEFEQFCIDNGIETITSTKNRPTTLGKIENFHGCYDSEIWITKGNHAKFMWYWNNKRPCGAIGYLYPVEVFYRDRETAINSG